MDRDEYLGVVEAGDASATACISEGPSMEPALPDASLAVCCDESPLAEALAPEPPLPVPHAVTVEPDAADITPAQVVEALLFASDTPLSAARLAELAGGGTALEVRLHIADLNAKYAACGLSFRIEAIARGYQMMTGPQYRPWVAKLNQHRLQTRLSAAALETLSIVAYKQPVIRAEIEAIRGVACGDVLSRLREMGLVRVVGRAEIVGRPMLYGTTRKFLDVFGLADLDDLPPMEALTLRRADASATAMAEDAGLDEPPTITAVSA
jgi:segregation and condensation protein B